jgi:hypothetical protein
LEKEGNGCALSYAAGTAVAIVPNFPKLFFLFLLVFIGFFSGRFAASTHIVSDVTMSYSNHSTEECDLGR